MPATAGGSTSGSSTSVTTTSRIAPRRLAIQYAAGVPNPRISTIASAFVSAVTRIASSAAVLPSAESRSPAGRAGRPRRSAAAGRAARRPSRGRAPRGRARATARPCWDREEAGVPQRLLPHRREESLDPCSCRRLVGRPRHDRDLVADARLRPGRDADDRDLRADRPGVGRVDEAGVRLAERDLAGHGLHVGLLADDLREHRGQAHLAEDRPRVAADRNRGAGDDELHGLPLQVVDRVDPRRVRPRHDQDEPVRRERDRLVDESLRGRGAGCSAARPRRRRPPERRS